MATTLHPVYSASGLARPVEPRYPTNLAIMVITAVAALIGVGLRLTAAEPWGAALLAGLNLGLVAFLTWALTRELSPDDNPAAFVAVLLAALGWARVGEGSLLLLAGALMAVRLVNRSTGQAATPVDSAVVTAGFAALAWWLSWALGLVGALALALDAALPSPQGRRRIHLAAAGLVAAVTVARLVVGVAPIDAPAHLPVFAGVAGLGLLAALAYPRPRSVGDVDGQPLAPSRVRLGLALGVVAAASISLDRGFVMQRATPLWAAVAATAVSLPWLWLRLKLAARR